MIEIVLKRSLWDEIVVDNFAGGGGASMGIKNAIGRDVDIAINHDPAAIKMHMVNHPLTTHYQDNVWNVDIRKVTGGRPIALAWFSPDCKHFSKAKGGKPCDKNIRGLAWVAVKWAAKVRPRVIMLENVEEFQTWGPLLPNNKPDLLRKGQTFRSFVNALRNQGYQVDWRELWACDYGAPTKRKRFFLIARCDGRPISWPEPTHGDPESPEVKAGILKPWHTAAEIIQWEIPCPSIFERKKPLCEATLRRISRGIQKFVVDNPKPFLIQYHGEQSSKEVRGQSLDRPLMVVDASNRYALVAPFMSHYYGKSIGSAVNSPVGTITARGEHIAEVQAFLVKYYGADIGQPITDPLHTITTRDRFGLVTIHGQPYQIKDIGMRMLTPRELFRAQGFPDSYIIDHDIDGKPYPKSAQVARCGNAVPPQLPEALVRANLGELCMANIA